MAHLEVIIYVTFVRLGGVSTLIEFYFIVGELLSKTSRTFDPYNVLLRRDIWISKQTVAGKETRILNVRLKSSKESLCSTRGIVVEVNFSGSFLTNGYLNICISRFLRMNQCFAL